MKAMILAAGEGQRFRPFTEILPKPAIPFCGYPLLYFSLYQLQKLSISELVINAYHLPDKIKGVVKDLPSVFSFKVNISDERIFGKLLGSGGGIALAKNHLMGEGSFLVLNADEVILPKQPDFMVNFKKYFENSNAFATLLTMNHPEAGKKFGAVWVDPNNKVKGFGKTPPAGATSLRPLHFLGTQILKDSVFNYLKSGEESNILYDAMVAAIYNGETVNAFPIECYWHETGNLQDFLIASEYCLNMIANKDPYLTSFYQQMGNEFYFVPNAQFPFFVHQSVSGCENVILDGFCVIGAGSKIQADTQLKNVIISNNKIITTKSRLMATIVL